MRIQQPNRRASRERPWGSQLVAGAAGAATALLLVWLHSKHSHALAVMPGQPGDGSRLLADPREEEQQQQLHQAGQQSAQAQQQAAVPAAPRLDLDSLPHLFLSFGNAAYFELAHNWAKSVQALGIPYLIAAFDEEMIGMCAVAGLACRKIEFGQAADFRQDFAAFRAMGAVKVRFVLSVLEDHPALPLVVVSDSDTVWLRSPFAYLEQRPGAEFFISSDCLSHQVEESWEAEHGQPRCGHIPGNDARAFNTGLFATRNTPAARSVLRAWADMLTDPSKEHADDPMHRGIDDQLAMNQLLEAGGMLAVSEDDNRTVLAWEGRLRLQTLPVVLFSNGHVAFVQQIPWKLGIAPIVIHTTFQRHSSAGKKSRLREFQLWHMDPPEYYGRPALAGAAPGSISISSSLDGAALGGAAAAAAEASAVSHLRLLAYQNDVPSFVAGVEVERYGAAGRRMPLMEKHWVGMTYQLAAFRDALAAARILNRTLVVPQLWCWCDSDEHPHILMRCRTKGTDYSTPFECPLDFLLIPSTLESYHLPYRHARFLEHPQVPDTLRHSRALLRIMGSKPERPFPAAWQTVGHATTLWPGILSTELQQAVAPVESASVLVLSGRVAGFFGGWPAVEREAAAEFDSMFSDVANAATWCCFGWGDADVEYQELAYGRPTPLLESWRPYAAPVLALPDWCDNVSTTYGNRNFTLLPQHPCAFLRNATAAELAANDSGSYNTKDPVPLR